MEKIIDATIGYKVIEDNGIVKYYCGHSYDGYIYKDNNAFKEKKGVCYIPEASYEDVGIDFITGNSADVYTYNDICNCIREFIDDVPEEFIEHMAECLFNSVDWECPETYLSEIDIEEEYREWKSKMLK